MTCVAAWRGKLKTITWKHKMSKYDVPIKYSKAEALAALKKAASKKDITFSEQQSLMDQYKEILGSTGYAKGGLTKKQQAKVGKVMGEFKDKTLHSGKGGKVVKNPKQAIAIALSEARKVKKK